MTLKFVVTDTERGIHVHHVFCICNSEPRVGVCKKPVCQLPVLSDKNKKQSGHFPRLVPVTNSHHQLFSQQVVSQKWNGTGDGVEEAGRHTSVQVQQSSTGVLGESDSDTLPGFAMWGRGETFRCIDCMESSESPRHTLAHQEICHINLTAALSGDSGTLQKVNV